MLTQIKLINFKCFKEETAFPLSQFNLFTGVNGNGKSTLLQSILLMRQSIEHDLYTTELILNGSCVNLGSFDDVRNCETSTSEAIFFEFSICNANNISSFEGSIRYRLKPNKDNMSLHIPEIAFHDANKNKEYSFIYTDKELYKLINEERLFRLINLEPPNSDVNNIITHSVNLNFGGNNGGIQTYLNFKKIHFISADRIGPQEFYLKSTLSDFRHVGAKGEFTVNLLDKLAQELVNKSLCLGEDAETLITQTEVWLGTILNPLKLEVPQSKTNILELFIGDFKPANVGFGYSSILPIIVSGLIAKPGEKIIIENPEIHLHPKAQSALIEFLVKVANTGVQIFVESHSDHVLNALRIAVLKEHLTPEDTNILYFQGKNQKTVRKINILKGGRIEEWPENFFDQIDIDFSVLFGV